jgi:arylsulfatase A-like enzyme
MKPNVLFIMTDQQRWDCVGANGNDVIRTPNLDRLAADGVNFPYSFTNATACVPSRACIMSGQHVKTHGVSSTGAGMWLTPETPTLPGVFSSHGYTSIGVGKMHFTPWDYPGGFDERVIADSKYDTSKGKDDYRIMLKKKGLLEKTIGHHTPGFAESFKAMPSVDLDECDHIDSYIGAKGVDKLSELLDRESPFFLAVSFCGPHDPYDPPEPYASMYDPADMPEAEKREGELSALPDDLVQKMRAFGKDKLDVMGVDDDRRRQLLAYYYGNVTQIDHWVGRLLDELDDAGVYDETIVLFTSDHGDYLGDHNIYWKGYYPCDADCRVPLIIKAPGLSGDFGKVMVGNVDLMPTLLSLAGLPAQETCDGRDLSAALNATDEHCGTQITYNESGPSYRVRSKRFSYVSRSGRGDDQLFDLESDPHELNNVIADLGYGPELHALRSELRNFLTPSLTDAPESLSCNSSRTLMEH